MHKRAITLDILVPMMNERDGLATLRREIEEAVELAENWRLGKIILIDDGSTDGTVDAARELFGDSNQYVVLTHQQNRGIAAAIRTGLARAESEFACSIDADVSYRPSEIESLVKGVRPDTTMVTASPYHPQGSVDGVPRWRLFLSRSLSWLYARTTGKTLTCYTSCFRLYDVARYREAEKRMAKSRMKWTEEGFVGVAETICKLILIGAEVEEVPARLRVRTYGQSKMRVIQVGRAHLRFLRKLYSLRKKSH